MGSFLIFALEMFIVADQQIFDLTVMLKPLCER